MIVHQLWNWMMISIERKRMSPSLIIWKGRKTVLKIGVAVVACDYRRAAVSYVVSAGVLFGRSLNSASTAVVRSMRSRRRLCLDPPENLSIHPTSACCSEMAEKFLSTWTQTRRTLIFHYRMCCQCALCCLQHNLYFWD